MNDITALAAPVAQTELTPADRAEIDKIKSSLNFRDTTTVLQYGSAPQEKISDFSASALANVRTKDMGAIGDSLAGLVGELKGLDFNGAGKKSLFKSAKSKIQDLKIRYDKAEVNVVKISEKLEDHQRLLLKDTATLDSMYDLNLKHFKELTLYIAAGKEALEAARTGDLPALQAKATASGLAEDAQAAKDFADQLTRFDKKLYDLELTRTISLQMAPQIRIIQNNDTTMIEKIQSSLTQTIPLWKSQMVLALSLGNTEAALQAQRGVTDFTNELLKKNAEMLHQGSIDVARENERGIVDLETLQHTNEKLIQTLDEVRQIQVEGAEKRRSAEGELTRIEGELKQKLLEFR
ncbi:MAG: toxic anion resistance protein [Oscillospiraceae bacterium]|jgi:uncharacterized protein YaaN involved in tellurite resistance|nr:toxic anion resistance protein [Oscillospiraceae bacterium]